MGDGKGIQSELLERRAVSGERDEPTLVQGPDEVRHSAELSRPIDQPPAKIPGYVISKCLGEGAYGSVWLAREQNTGKQVAIKFYTHRRGLDWSLLNREVEKLAVLYTSRNIVGLLDVGWDSDPPHYVMEYLENGSLAAFLEEGPLAPAEAVRIAKSVLQALVHAHGSGILHCDLKPANVLLDADLSPRLCDFGQSRLSDEQNPALGTLFYMAPEQADLKAVPDARWDVYALGALLYHMLCGEAPYRTAEHERLIHSAETLEERLAVYRRVLRQSPKPNLHRKTPGVDKRLADIVDRCLQLDPHKRYPNAQAVLDALMQRDRQRARRPLMALGVVGPILLWAAMGFVVNKFLEKTDHEARQTLTKRALESDVLSARILAHSLERELEQRKADLREIANDPELRAAIEAAAATQWIDRVRLTKILKEKWENVHLARQEQGLEPDTSWFLTDAEGYQRWREPFSRRTQDKNWAHRDYFHGRGLEYDNREGNGPNPVPVDIQPIQEPHFSLAFQSQATLRYMVAISVPVMDEDGKVIGVLARTTHLGELQAGYGRRIHGEANDAVNRVIALADRHGELIDHPWINQQTQLHGTDSDADENDAVKVHPAAAERMKKVFQQLTLERSVLEKITRLQKNSSDEDHAAGDERPRDDDRDDDYDDPVGRIDTAAYEGEWIDTAGYRGKWLAAFSPVGKTGWTAIVQERKEDALQPVDEMQAGLKRYGLAALTVSAGLIALLWYFVQRQMNDRGGRNWAKNGGPRSRGTLTATTSTPSGR